MAESVKLWQSLPPPPFLVEDAVADPLRCLSLSAWKPLSELHRGAQLGATDYRSVWCIGLYRLPSDWALSASGDRRRLRVGPVVFVNPMAMRLLLRVDGSLVWKVGVRLARMDLLIPSHEKCLTWPAKIPGSGQRGASPMYALRGEVGFLEGAGLPAGLRAIAAVTRVVLSGWYAVNEPTELQPDPGWQHSFPSPKRRAQQQRKRPAPGRAKPAPQSSAQLMLI